MSSYRQQLISQEITKMLIPDIIEPYNGPYAAPITLQPKER